MHDSSSFFIHSFLIDDWCLIKKLELKMFLGSGNGKCIEGNCVCENGFHGKDCSEKNCLNNWYRFTLLCFAFKFKVFKQIFLIS